MTTTAGITSFERMVLASASAIAFLSGSFEARAQDYPARTIRVVVPWPPGGIVDIAARAITDKAKADLKQPIVIENRAGAGGSIGAAAVAKADPDGYTLMFTTSALNMNASLGRAPYDVVRDFAPVVIVANSPLVLVSATTLGAKTVRELVTLAKSKPGQLTYASAGNGSPAHFAAELFRRRTGTEAAHVPYKGAPEAMTDVMAGRISYLFANAAVGLPQVQAGTVTALAITSSRRLQLLPHVPTMAEAGVADFNAEQWLGFLAPSRTPKPVVDLLAQVVKKALASDDLKATFTRNGMDVVADSSPETFAAFIKADFQNWSEVAKAANIKIE